MKPFLLVAALVLSLSSSVRAEPTEPQKVAVDLAKLLSTPDSYKQMFDKMVESMRLNQPPESKNGPEFWKKFRVELEAIMPYQEAINDQVGLMTKYYTADEMRQMIAFYQSPVGQKSLRVMPDMMADIMADMQNRLQQRLPALVEKLKAEDPAPPAAAPARKK